MSSTSSTLLRTVVISCALLTLPLGVFAANVMLPADTSLPLVSPLNSPLPSPGTIPGGISASTPLAQQDQTGAYIQLNLTRASRFIGATVVVQWQDSKKQWQDVPGWRNMLGAKMLRWWVSPQDFGAGPFRWVVIRKKVIVAQSRPFNLPTNADDILMIRAD